jgi:hypothetical protein
MKNLSQTLSLAVALCASTAGAASPTIVCSADQTLECTSTNGAIGIVQATVLDPDGDALMLVTSISGQSSVTNVIAAGITTNGVTLSFTNQFADGTNEVVFAVTDDGTNYVTCTSHVIVQDTTPPTIESITAAPSLLWPPNHKMKPIRLNVKAHDVCGPVEWRITSIESNEPVDGRGDGNTSPDWSINAPNKAWLRAERAGPGNGRVYTINIEVSDDSNNSTNGNVKVYVPHDRGHRKYHDKHDFEDDEQDGPGNGNGNGNGKGKAKGKNK